MPCGDAIKVECPCLTPIVFFKNGKVCCECLGGPTLQYFGGSSTDTGIAESSSGVETPDIVPNHSVSEEIGNGYLTGTLIERNFTYEKAVTLNRASIANFKYGDKQLDEIQFPFPIYLEKKHGVLAVKLFLDGVLKIVGNNIELELYHHIGGDLCCRTNLRIISSYNQTKVLFKPSLLNWSENWFELKLTHQGDFSAFFKDISNILFLELPLKVSSYELRTFLRGRGSRFYAQSDFGTGYVFPLAGWKDSKRDTYCVWDFYKPTLDKTLIPPIVHLLKDTGKTYKELCVENPGFPPENCLATILEKSYVCISWYGWFHGYIYRRIKNYWLRGHFLFPAIVASRFVRLNLGSKIEKQFLIRFNSKTYKTPEGLIKGREDVRVNILRQAVSEMEESTPLIFTNNSFHLVSGTLYGIHVRIPSLSGRERTWIVRDGFFVAVEKSVRNTRIIPFTKESTSIKSHLFAKETSIRKGYFLTKETSRVDSFFGVKEKTTRQGVFQVKEETERSVYFLAKEKTEKPIVALELSVVDSAITASELTKRIGFFSVKEKVIRKPTSLKAKESIFKFITLEEVKTFLRDIIQSFNCDEDKDYLLEDLEDTETWIEVWDFIQEELLDDLDYFQDEDCFENSYRIRRLLMELLTIVQPLTFIAFEKTRKIDYSIEDLPDYYNYYGISVEN